MSHRPTSSSRATRARHAVLGLALALGLSCLSPARAADAPAPATPAGAVATPTATAATPTEITRLTLLDGREISGDLKRRDSGIYEATEFGGRLHAWANIDPASLPADVVEALRGTTLDALHTAQALYEDEQLDAAGPQFKTVIAMRRYLTPADRETPAFQNIAYKARGFILLGDKWVTLATKKAEDGFYLYDGRWLTKAQIAEQRAYRDAFAKARKSQPGDGIIALKSVIAAYPDSELAPVAEQIITKLIEQYVNPVMEPNTIPAAPAPVVEPPEETPRERFTPDRASRDTRPRYNDGSRNIGSRYSYTYSTYGTYSGYSLRGSRPWIVVDRDGTTRFYGSSGAAAYYGIGSSGYCAPPRSNYHSYGFSVGGINGVYRTNRVPTIRFNF